MGKRTYNYCLKCARYVIDARKARKGNPCPRCGAECVNYHDEQMRQTERTARILDQRREELQVEGW